MMFVEERGNSMKIDYPSLILNLRVELNMNQEEFGKLLGVSLISNAVGNVVV